VSDYTGPERRVGPANRRSNRKACPEDNGGRYSDRRDHRYRKAGWFRRCLRGYFGWDRRKNEGRRTSLDPITGLRRAADRDRYDAYLKGCDAILDWLEAERP
jgi:hypothetical protein